MIRIISKAPCMVLRLGFPIGTPAQARHKVSRPRRAPRPRSLGAPTGSFPADPRGLGPVERSL